MVIYNERIGDNIVKKENFSKENENLFFSKLGFSKYDNLIFEDENEKENFKKSMSTYCDYLKSVEPLILKDKNRDRQYPEKLIQAIDESKYNVEAKIAKINYTIAPEYYKLELLHELKKEMAEYDEIKFDIGDEDINLLHYEVCEYIVKYYFNNEMYHNVIQFIDNEFKNISFFDEFYTEILFFKLSSYLYMRKFKEFCDLLNDAVNNHMRLNEFILISRLFYHLIQLDFYKAEGYFKELLYENDKALEYLNKVLVNDEIKQLDTNEESWEIKYLNYCFDFYLGMLKNTYFFDSLYTMVEDENGIIALEERYKKDSIALMKEDDAFEGLSQEELEILADSEYNSRYSFYFSTRWDVLEETGISMSTLRKLEKNGVMFYEDEK